MPIIKKSHKENVKKFCVETLPWLAVSAAGVAAMVLTYNKYEAQRTNSYSDMMTNRKENNDASLTAYVNHLEKVYEHIVEK